jgi:hypothetical protein
MSERRLLVLLALCTIGLALLWGLTNLGPSTSSNWTGLLDQSNHSGRVLDDWERISSILENIVTIVALALGAVVGYFKFIKGRVYRPRVEPDVTGRIKKYNGTTFLIVRSEARNVGNSKILIGPSSGLDISFDAIESDEQLPIRTVKWKEPTSFRVFREHKWIESGETIREEQMFSVPTYNIAAVKVALHLAVGKVTATSMKVLLLNEELSEKKGG